MFVYKIANKNYASKFVASGIDGRWSSGGRLVIYTAESIALSFLESMIRRHGIGFNNDFKTILIHIPDDLQIEKVELHELPKGWNNYGDYAISQSFGNKWCDDLRSPLLKVPSVLLPDSFNYVINTVHTDFSKIEVAGITDLTPDPRIEDILKNYKK